MERAYADYQRFWSHRSSGATAGRSH